MRAAEDFAAFEKAACAHGIDESSQGSDIVGIGNVAREHADGEVVPVHGSVLEEEEDE